MTDKKDVLIGIFIISDRYAAVSMACLSGDDYMTEIFSFFMMDELLNNFLSHLKESASQAPFAFRITLNYISKTS